MLIDLIDESSEALSGIIKGREVQVRYMNNLEGKSKSEVSVGRLGSY